MAVENKLPPYQFDNVVRLIKRAELERVNVLFVALTEALARVGVKPNGRRAVKGTPAGSDQWDVGSIVSWSRRVPAGDNEAVQQLVQLHATAYTRIQD